MPISHLKGNSPEGFNNPTALPQDAEQAREWQEANRAWWESNPMRYDFGDRIGHPEFSREFYEEIDRRFFSDAEKYLPRKKTPFDALIDFEALPNQDVLEIGVGNGSHAQLLATHARSYNGIDLTSYAVKSTTERMRRFNLDKPTVTVQQMDAERMEFADESFDFIWTWGVIHHSSNTRQILSEMRRVLRPGGRAVTMVYYRNLWNYYIYAGLFGGLIKGHLWKTGSLHQTRQHETDGAIARFYSIPEWKQLTSEFFTTEDTQICGSKPEIVPLPRGRVKESVLKIIPDQLSRFMTNNCRMGTFLVSVLKKES
jgi:ubiquinone/menaquinone biosynthesis C-methylase UbiE